MANPFVEIERKYREVAQSYQQGELDPEQFAEALEALRIQDDQEQWWQIQGNGKWLRFSGSEWEEASPPRPGPPPPPRAALVPPPRKLQPAAASAVKDVLGELSPVHDLDDSIFFQIFTKTFCNTSLAISLSVTIELIIPNTAPE